MFTGIIESLGKVESLQSVGGDVRLRIGTSLDMSDVHLGDSIATNGICLTVIEWGENWYAADVSRESLNRTTLGTWKVGQRVNVEKAMLPTTRFGGHIVSGHVDAVGEITVVREDARSIYYEVTAPAEIAKYLAEKGSVTVDGISLTINHLRGNVISLNLIPHTAERTNIGTWKTGAKVNLEVDVLARYIERLMLGDKAAETKEQSKLSMAFLAENGFLK
ncbi:MULTISPECIES: riboflavin synthase [Acinetobacter Taxon 24]|jgi:riboflavin synthase|uniref:Riboflavin synthase n=1 Tax=Acinetobacter terrae TaxID=2731247 RepID=A0A241VKK7_9GAMM|nr:MULTISPECIES: riboflavin synthase [Acinetobacter Taxon 24]NNG76990.1 riboflavin synthase [Acinetobacter terrae]NNG82756.1 riboflavin synthase [Acinetobacter sp. ANC 5378]NNH14730.1 riboflavin synthase [Acinetobacter terrae]NNH76748.1 riboflavin synthase [Acinetobacter terrae]NNH87061.1 riboflavin synthase [Acinetobacter terrae]